LLQDGLFLYLVLQQSAIAFGVLQIIFISHPYFSTCDFKKYRLPQNAKNTS